MRVLLFSYELPPLGGGVGTAVAQLLSEWQHVANLEIVVITSSLENRFKRETFSENITIQYIPTSRNKNQDLHSQSLLQMIGYSLMSVVTAFYYRLHWSPDVSLAFGYPGPIASWLLHWLGGPFVVALRGVDVPGYNPRFSWGKRLHSMVARVLWWAATSITANSSWLASRAKQTAPERSFQIIPNGVDTKLFRPVPFSEKYDLFTITAGGTLLNNKKQLHLILEGFAKFLKENPTAKSKTQVMLIGSGEAETALRQLAKELGIEANVDFVGRKSQAWIAQELPKCHIFCLPSLAEGMSNAALEALAAGLPLVLNDVGAATEMVQGNGFVYSDITAKNISRALTKLYKDPERMKQMSQQSRKISENYRWPQIASSYRKLLEKAE